MQARRAQRAEEKVKRCEAIGRAATDLAERRRRNRKRNGLKAALTAEYEARKTFTRQTCKELAERHGLSVAQVYKWGWDYRKRKEQGLE
jgi:crotonobetainyl-CoA:carnitine CoA-transferase CaiB-like acyl-CoA transferase